MNLSSKPRPFLLLLVLLVTGVWILSTCSGFNGLYGQDSFEYLRYSRAIHALLSSGNPMGIFYWPVLYPLAGSLLSFLLPDIISLQLISIFCYGLTALFLEKILRRMEPERASESRVFVLLFYGLSPFVLRYSMTIMSEMPALFLITAFYYNYLIFQETRQGKNFLWLVTAGLAAVITRYPAVVLISIPLIHAGYLFIRNFKPGYFALSVLSAGILIFAEFYLHGRWHDSILARPLFASWSPMNLFSRSFFTSDGHLEYRVPNILFVLKSMVFPGFIFAGALFLLFFRRAGLRQRFQVLTCFSWLLYSLFLAVLPVQNDRLLLPGFPLVLVLLSVSFLRISGLLEGTRRRYLSMAITLVVVIQFGLFYRAFIPFYKNNQATKAVIDAIKLYPGKQVYTFNMDQALGAYYINNPVINLYSVRVEQFEPGALVLFNVDQSRRQWEGYNPMINWNRLKATHRLDVIKNLPEGWVLYEIGN